MQIVAFHAKNGFDLVWFICLEVPMYSFCIWAFAQAWKMIEEKEKENKKNKMEL